MRYADRPFPAYRYLPGRAPHPTRDPNGHSYGVSCPKLERFDPALWQACEQYRYGVDLFNHGYWWEAHEAWEAIWVAAGRRTEAGLFLQGLIQLAVALLKDYQGFDVVARRLATAGLAKFPSGSGVYLGIDLAELERAVDRYFSGQRDARPLIALRLHEMPRE